MARCKPGDLAIVIKAMHQQNIGRVVKVVRYSQETPFDLPCGCHVPSFENSDDWVIRAENGPFFHSGCPHGYATILDEALMPIRPDSTEPQEERRADKVS